MNPFRRLLNLFRRKPGMIGVPPSARQVPADAGLHAVDFSRRYADSINYHVENRMMELGFDPDQIGWGDVGRGIRHAAFHPHGRVAGNVSPDGRIIVDSGLFNPELVRGLYGDEAAGLFWRSRLRDRMDAIIAHEFEEHRHGFDHEAALKATPRTKLPIGDRAREIASAMEQGWIGR